LTLHGIGLSHRPARVNMLAGRYGNPMPESTISPVGDYEFGLCTLYLHSKECCTVTSVREKAFLTSLLICSLQHSPPPSQKEHGANDIFTGNPFFFLCVGIYKKTLLKLAGLFHRKRYSSITRIAASRYRI
jgi:hypothetical protein